MAPRAPMPAALAAAFAILVAACGGEPGLRPGEGVGRASGTGPRCGGCHAHEEKEWAASPHGRHATPVRTPPGGADGAVGSKWMQAYIYKDPAGGHRIRPVCYDIRDNMWRDVGETLLGISGIGLPGVERSSIPDVSTRFFDVDCSGCHSSGARVRYDAVLGRIEGAWRDLAIDCEACHGMGKGHEDGQPGTIVRLQDLPPRTQVTVCGRCHGGPATVGDVEPAETGDMIAFLGDHSGLFADGTPAGQSYQLSTFVRSPCFSQGGLTCTGCHDAHGPDLKSKEDTDALCAGCHAGYADRSHTHHDPKGDGARCLECHMPRLLSGLSRHQRDHRISVPVPALRDMPDACTACHRDKDAAWSQRSWTSWYGEPPPEKIEAVEAVLAARALARDTARRLRPLLHDADAFFRVKAVSHLGPEPETRNDSAPEVRWTAVRALYVKEDYEALKGYLRDPAALVRAEAAVALAEAGHVDPRDHRDDIQRLIRCVRDHPAARRVMAGLLLQEGRAGPANDLLEEALAFSPGVPETWFVLAELQRVRRQGVAFETSVRRGVDLLVAAATRGEPSDMALGRYIQSLVRRGFRPLASALLIEAAQRFPSALARQRFAEMRERLLKDTPPR